MTAKATASQATDASSRDDATTLQPPSSELGKRRPVAPEPLDDALSPSPLDEEPPPSAAPPDEEDEVEDVDDVDVVPPELDVLGFVPPVTVNVRVVLRTPSFAVPAPLADIAAM